MRIVERAPAGYEIAEMSDLGRSYKWRSEQVTVECEKCGNRTTFGRSKLLTSIVTCRCGARSTAGVREELLVELRANDEAANHPWRYSRWEKGTGIPF